MDSTNKVLALFVGLFVVILLVGVGLSRLAKNKKPLTGVLGTILTTKATITTTPTPIPKRTPKLIIIPSIAQTTTTNTDSSYSPNNASTQEPSSIPETGATSMPMIVTVLGGGLYVLKYVKKG